jgi:hypothetical protein
LSTFIINDDEAMGFVFVVEDAFDVADLLLYLSCVSVVVYHQQPAIQKHQPCIIFKYLQSIKLSQRRDLYIGDCHFLGSRRRDNNLALNREVEELVIDVL